MNKEKFKELMKRCFGKEKEEKAHAIAMLVIYGIFMVFALVYINLLPDAKENKPTPSPTSTPSVVENYNYKYVVKFDNGMYTIDGKKLDNKETFTYIEGDISNEYAIISNILYIMKDGNYEKSAIINPYYKYLNKDKVLGLIDYNKCLNNDNSYVCDIDSKTLANTFSDSLTNDNDTLNPVFIVKENNEVKSIKLDLDNYISNIMNSNHSLEITMEYSKEGSK